MGSSVLTATRGKYIDHNKYKSLVFLGHNTRGCASCLAGLIKIHCMVIAAIPFLKPRSSVKQWYLGLYSFIDETKFC